MTQSPHLQQVLDTLDAGVPAALDRLMEFLRIPSVSTDPAHRDDCRKAGQWLVDELASLGFDARLRDTPGHPVVVAHSPRGAGRRIMFYGHYDVQPVDPLELWSTPPFEPHIEGSGAKRVIRARGAADDKGQLMTFIEAFRAWKDVHGALPPNLTLLFEGEEETGSLNLRPFLHEHADELRADIAMVCDTGMYGDGRPAITTQLRGLLGEEIVIHAADRDLHSGFFGGIAANPIEVLCDTLATLKDDNGRITLPGFYDDVHDLSPELRGDWEKLAFDAGRFLGQVGLRLPMGEKGRDPLEMMWSQPTCEINGITGGYTGAGFKTVLPAQASAKVSFRLTGDQDPQAIRTAFRAHIRGLIPDDCSVEFHDHGASPASLMNTTDPAFALAKQALSEEWNREATFVGSGGTIPIVGAFQDILGMDSILIGFGRDDDRIHSPNEKYNLESFTKGARSWARILTALA